MFADADAFIPTHTYIMQKQTFNLDVINLITINCCPALIKMYTFNHSPCMDMERKQTTY